MNKRIKNSFLPLMICLVLTAAGMSRAEMSSTNYLLAPHVISAGGHISLEANGKRLNDIKGQGIAGEMSSTNYGLGLGGIYGTGPTVIEGDWPYGTVPLYISRDGQDIKITWEAVFRNPDIYVLTGAGTGVYGNSPAAAGWMRIVSGGIVLPGIMADEVGVFSLSGNALLNREQVGMGFGEVYYKGLQQGITPTTIDPANGQLCFSNARAAGKVNVNISRAGANGWNFIAYPFDVRPIGAALFGNFSAADEIKIRDEATKQFAPVSVTYSAAGGQWGTQPFERAKGYWLYRSQTTPLTATLIGTVNLTGLTTSLTRVRDNGWNFIGLPYPTMRTLAAFGPAAASSLDELKVRNEDSKQIEASYPKSTWGTQQIRTAKGYLYYRAVPATLPWEIAY